jgi:hypothetical protein
MTTTTKEIREAELAVAEAELRVRTAKLALARAKNRAPQEPTKLNTLLRFKVRYREGEQAYTYTALKLDGGWLVSGKRYQGRLLTWDEVVNIADKNVPERAHFEDLGV